MNIEKIPVGDSGDLKLPWRKFAGRVVPRSEITALLESAEALLTSNAVRDPDELDVVRQFATRYLQMFDGEYGDQLLAMGRPSEGEAIALEGVPMVRTTAGLQAVVQRDTIASLQSSLPDEHCGELRRRIGSWAKST